MQFTENKTSYFFLLLIGFVAILQVYLAFNYKINTDEFFFLSQVYEYSRGELSGVLQTFHVHFFSWLTSTEGYEIEKINTARLSMLVAELVTVAAIIVSSRAFAPLEYAVFAGFAWMVSGYTLSDGTSFRTDPLATALLMSAIALSLSEKLDLIKISLAAVFVSIAGLVTIKSVLYAPAFLAVVFWQNKRLGSRRVTRLLFVAIVVAVISFISFFLFHKAGITVENVTSTFVVSRAIQTGFLNSRFVPEPASLVGWVILSIAPLYLIYVALKNKDANWLFFLPVLSVILYRNSFPYFYPFITAPAFILVAIGAKEYVPNKCRNYVLSFFIIFNVIFHLYNASLNNQQQQKIISSVIHQIFPEPVGYIDQIAMVPTYPKRSFFMTDWGMRTYHDKGELVINEVLSNFAPPLLIANHKVLLEALGEIEKEENRLYLFPEDSELLKSSYVKYWGGIFVAGIERKLTNGASVVEINIPGRYRNESDTALKINGNIYQMAEVIELDRGEHIFSAEQEIILRLVWAEAGPRPSIPEPENFVLF